MKKIQKLVTAHNFELQGWKPTGESLTVPGQVLNLETILNRFRRGQGVQTFTPVYNPDFPADFDKLDKLGKIDAAREQAAKVAAMKKQMSDEAKAQAKREAEAESKSDIQTLQPKDGQ